MKTKAIEIGLVIAGLFLLALLVVGCEEKESREEVIARILRGFEVRIAALEARPVFDPNKCILRYKLDDFDLHPIYDPNMAVINLCSEAKDPNEYGIGLFSTWTAEGQRLAEKEPSMREFLCPCGRKYKSAGISHNIYELRNNYWVPILDQNE